MYSSSSSESDGWGGRGKARCKRLFAWDPLSSHEGASKLKLSWTWRAKRDWGAGQTWLKRMDTFLGLAWIVARTMFLTRARVAGEHGDMVESKERVKDAAVGVVSTPMVASVPKLPVDDGKGDGGASIELEQRKRQRGLGLRQGPRLSRAIANSSSQLKFHYKVLNYNCKLQL